MKLIFKDNALYEEFDLDKFTKGIEQLNIKIGIDKQDKIEMADILYSLDQYVKKGLINYIPQNYNEAVKMLCNQKIKYYQKLIDLL